MLNLVLVCVDRCCRSIFHGLSFYFQFVFSNHYENDSFTGQCSFFGSQKHERSVFVTVAGDTTTIPSDLSEGKSIFGSEHPKFPCKEKPSEIDRDIDDKEDKSDKHKMIPVCDKLIEVFMVDKPTTTDWRRLLAFSREWENIRPHFYRRCEVRGNAEEDPEIKQKLFRLARKLKEVNFLCFTVCRDRLMSF